MTRRQERPTPGRLSAAIGWAIAVSSLASAGGWPAARAEPAVTCPNPLVTVYDGGQSPADDAAAAVRIVGTRGAAVAGQVVVHSAQSAAGPTAKVSDLAREGGEGTIPASAVEVHYAAPIGRGESAPFDSLMPAPRAEGRVHPVWLIVNVPPDARAGEYAGTVTLAGPAVGGSPRRAPVRLTVHDWPCPSPDRFTTFADFVESPESLAMQYDVPLWSDRHFALLRSCFGQLARVGNKSIYLELAGETNFGNAQTMVRWIAGDGPRKFTHDFTMAEKYLDAALAAGIRPEVIVYYLWEPRVGGSVGRTPEEVQRGVRFSLLDPATGKVTTAEGPSHNNANPGYPNYPADTIAFWKPVLDGLLERVRARKLDEKTIVLGIFKDGARPGEATVSYLKQLAPYAAWCDHAHGSVRSICGMPVGYDTTVWNAMLASDPAAGRTYGWQRSQLVAQFDRDMGVAVFEGQVVRSRLLGEINVTGKQRGFGRMAADFWPVLKDDRGRSHSIAARYPNANWAQLNLRATSYLAPGPDGACPTIRLQMVREGLAECEARIFIEKALLDKSARARLGQPLADRVQKLLDDRVAAAVAAMGDGLKRRRSIKLATVRQYANGDWQDQSGRLFAAAAEVAAALNAPPAATPKESR